MQDDAFTARKRERERRTMEQMLRIYCRGKHHEGRGEDGLCPSCRELWEYARVRIARCPFMRTKTFCSACPVHCYAPDRRREIREVMRYSGPRMLLHAPILTLHHFCIQLETKWNQRKNRKGKREVVK